jgi:hypothetical protein
MLSDKYLWPVPELTLVHKAYELASFQEPVTLFIYTGQTKKAIAEIRSGHNSSEHF